jgi:glutathione S-transferase
MWSSLEFQPPFIEIFIQKMFVPEERRSQEVIDKAMGKLPALYTVLDNTLSEKNSLEGSEFTIADLNAASVAAISQMVGFDASSYSNLKRWVAEISKRPAFQKYIDLANTK